MEKLDSDGDPEAEPEDLTPKVVEPAVRTVRELNAVVASVTKDKASGITGADVKKAGDLFADRVGIAQESTVWRKESSVMAPLVEAIEAAIESDEDTAEAFKLATTGEVE